MYKGPDHVKIAAVESFMIEFIVFWVFFSLLSFFALLPLRLPEGASKETMSIYLFFALI